ncbi:hypothetical protein [Scytonema sp. NUACC26]|uniref:hypothetical protein n=1 Tax=Scytonema sp. NUACC26 TaxID=3140176 RepID=UPI0034DB9162
MSKQQYLGRKLYEQSLFTSTRIAKIATLIAFINFSVMMKSPQVQAQSTVASQRLIPRTEQVPVGNQPQTLDLASAVAALNYCTGGSSGGIGGEYSLIPQYTLVTDGTYTYQVKSKCLSGSLWQSYCIWGQTTFFSGLSSNGWIPYLLVVNGQIQNQASKDCS